MKHSDCERDQAHQNDGDDVCARCGEDLHGPAPAKPRTRQKPVCKHCGSENVRKDAYAEWLEDDEDGEHEDGGEWVLSTTFDNTVCEDCGADGNNILRWEDIKP